MQLYSDIPNSEVSLQTDCSRLSLLYPGRLAPLTKLIPAFRLIPGHMKHFLAHIRNLEKEWTNEKCNHKLRFSIRVVTTVA